LVLFICTLLESTAVSGQITAAGGRTQIKRGETVDRNENLFYKGRKEGKGAGE
jgi:hypothetical protein